MTKADLIQILIEDFKKMFPECKEAEKRALFFRLNMLDVKDLELLVSQVEK